MSDTLQITREWAGWYYDQDRNSDKVWAGAVSEGGLYLAVWGRRGTRYESQMKNLGTYQAEVELDKKIREKRSKGYHDVRFNDPAAGDIPSFRGRATPGAETEDATGDITADSLLLRMQRLADLLDRRIPRAHRETQFLEFTQLGMIMDALVIARALDATQHDALAACYHVLTGKVQTALLA